MTHSSTVDLNRRELPVVATGIDPELLLDCVHCGLCTSACPTYVELGDENDGPRGRIYLMRALSEGRIELDRQVQGHLDLCLDCRACESACPSGVQYGRLIEPFRLHLAKSGIHSDGLNFLQRWLLYHVTPSAARMRWALAPARFLQRSGIDALIKKSGLLRWLPRSLRQFHDMLPLLGPALANLPELLPAEGPRRARVALFTGCAGDAFYPATTLATARVLQRNGCEVWIPRTQVCCGALHYHAAQEAPAQAFAKQNCEVFLSQAESLDAIIVNAAGCGAMFKEYGHAFHNTPWADQATSLAKKVRDISEFLIELGPIAPSHPLRIKATYHDACHLCHGQQIRQQPRQLLKLIPELELVPLIETELCCGAAGSYNLTQPEMAERLGRRKAEHLLATGADAIFAGNVGCLLQIGRYLREQKPNLWLAHPIDALWASYQARGLD